MDENPSMEALMNSVGHCLREWSHVEYNMMRLFLSVHNAPLHEALLPPLRAAFECVQSLEIRLAMLNKSIETSLPLSGDFLENWTILNNKISKMAKKRNQVAHFMAGDTSAVSDQSEFKVFPFYSLTGQLTGTAISPLSNKDLKQRQMSFRTLHQRVHRFYLYNEIRTGRRPRDHAPAGDLLNLLRNPNAQNPKET
tara:strand:+ start:15020 stop:15607 length:588 start_codon:yes stop_codon:yes gene_type:complete